MPEKTFKTRPMTVKPFSRSSVNIIIPFHGQYEKVIKLVQSILFCTKSNPYQICLVDDYSQNGALVQEWLLKSDLAKKTIHYKPQLVVHRTPEQLGFGGALRYGFERTEEPWVVFIHSDCVVEDSNWLIAMGKSLLDLKKDQVRMVSARTNNPGAGAYKLLQGKRGEYIDDAILEEGSLPLYCVMAHRDLFHHIGGFIKEYPFGWYEDEELAYRMKHRGYKQAVCGRSWVHHEGGATVNQLWADQPSAKKIMESNRERCVLDMKSL